MIKYITFSIWSLVFCFVSISTSSAQEDSLSLNFQTHKEIGLNFTQFVSQFVPFNIKKVRSGPIGYSYKYYNRNNTALRFGFGANLSSSDDFADTRFSIRLGYEKRKHLSGKFYYTKGWDALAVLGSFNLPSKTGNNSFGPVAAVGFGPVIGVEYHITDKIIFTTESMLFLGISAITFLDISILPPTAFFIHFRF